MEVFMNLRQLEYFKELAETEHMTQAAQKLNITQPNLSHAIKSLETELDVDLFRKRGRNIELTKYGRMFYQTVSNVLMDLEEGILAIKEDVDPIRGLIDLGFTYTMSLEVVPKMVTGFHQDKKYKDVRFSFKQGNSTQLIEYLLNEDIDLALCSKISDDERLEYIPFVEEEIVIITPKDHPLAKYDILDLKDLKPYPFVGFNNSSGLRPTIDALFRDVGIVPNVKYEVEEDQALASLVQYNFGVALIPNMPTLNAYNVKVIRIKNPSVKRFLYIASLKQNFRSQTVDSFIDYLLEHRSL